jgi:hypothetical protein
VYARAGVGVPSVFPLDLATLSATQVKDARLGDASEQEGGRCKIS